MLAIVAEVLSHGAARVRSKELQRRRIRSSGSNYGGVLEAIVLPENLEQLCHGRALLAYGHVNAIEVVLFVGAVVDCLLVEDGVDGNGSFARLTIADNKFPLPAANGDEAVHCLQARGHRLMDALARDDARCLQLHAPALGRVEGASAIDGCAQGVDDTAQELLPDGDIDDGAGALHAVALDDGAIVAEDDNTNIVGLQIQGHALQAARELHHLACLHALETINTGDTIPDAEHSAHLLDIRLVLEVRDPVAENLCELCRAHLRRPRCRRCVQRPRHRSGNGGQRPAELGLQGAALEELQSGSGSHLADGRTRTGGDRL
mmetsp:Transcript_16446/g.36308  ORF Transcript_16446/g.36308 Transcript_16446/m.36308 type:complete len:319 (-) Transcript_16446:42-998(-)